jgi:hypothetical protein
MGRMNLRFCVTKRVFPNALAVSRGQTRWDVRSASGRVPGQGGVGHHD